MINQHNYPEIDFSGLDLAKPAGAEPIANLRPLPHEKWPPDARQDELEEISAQRNKDIGIRGRSGPIKAFEEQFLKFMDGQIRYAVTFNSGTSSLLASYFAAGVKSGDEVIGPALTYHAALSPLFALGAKPILADINRNTRCIDPNDIERKITSKTKAITVVHQWGHPADMPRILEIARKHGLKVIEDCSHAHGSALNGKLCGSFGDVAAFSLQTNKMVFAGEGGILVTNNQNIHDRATLFGHYRDRSKSEIADPELQKFWVTGFGLKLRMSPFNAIVAKHSLAAYPERKEGRHQCLSYFIEKLAEFPFIEAYKPDGNVDMGAWYGFKPLYAKEKLLGLSRDQFVATLQAENVEVSAPSAPVLASTPLYYEDLDPLYGGKEKRNLVSLSELPVAVAVEACALSLPTFYDWKNDKPLIDKYVEAIRSVRDRVYTYAQAQRPGMKLDVKGTRYER